MKNVNKFSTDSEILSIVDAHSDKKAGNEEIEHIKEINEIF